jgi:hypothetical protein
MARAVRLALGVGLIACNICFAQDALPASVAPTPVLAELFTSEGCSSCPAADRYIQALDTQPIPGIQVIVLSEHVDYWNHEGWTDPYSSPDFSERQRIYGNHFRLADVYTPQLIIDGQVQTLGNRPSEVEAALREAGNRSKAVMQISHLSLEQNRLRFRIDVPPINLSGVRTVDVYVTLALNHAETQVTRGENANQRLTHTAVVRKIKRLGKLAPGQQLSQAGELKLDAKTASQNLRVVAFLQDPGSGRIVGAAMTNVGQQ